MAENKSNKQYFERVLSKSLTKFGHTTLKEQQIIRCLCFSEPTGFGKSRGKSLIYQGVVF
jgi:hypothetical protein